MATCRQCNGIGYIGSISSGVEGGDTCRACGGSGTTTDYNSFSSSERRTIKPLPKAVMVASSIIADDNSHNRLQYNILNM
ncbi:hypothetical protein [uncultured Paraglaciecola sp.]|uniref:hypothetical protein n=1 Tax=uncultured Paraglaciecola sp. TaxID=1765024 RepID=UPI00259143EE|nr:hypothetical protein [uncultured Paraglaciecola sp.]